MEELLVVPPWGGEAGSMCFGDIIWPWGGCEISGEDRCHGTGSSASLWPCLLARLQCGRERQGPRLLCVTGGQAGYWEAKVGRAPVLPRAPIPSEPSGHRGSTRLCRLLGCQPGGELTRKAVLFHPC